MVQSNKKFKKGFTMVELMVVLAITAILAALVGGGLIGYIRLARFEKNEANARTLFQAAQIALTRMDTAGELDDFRDTVMNNGSHGEHFAGELTNTDSGNSYTQEELNTGIYALYYDKTGKAQGNHNALVKELLGKYIYDDSMFDASICVEIDVKSGQVFSVFYDTNADKLRFNEADATNIYDRSYSHRRNDSLVGYYSAEDRVNVVELQQTQLKVKNPRLSNGETLTLSWSGNSRLNDLDTVYVATAYAEGDSSRKPLFEITIERGSTDDASDKQSVATLDVVLYNADGTPKGKAVKMKFPLSYSKGNFVLTLDAMADANLLRAAENTPDTARDGLFSMTRLLDTPQDFYIAMVAKPARNFEETYTASKEETTNTENSLLAENATATEGDLTYFRHLYNLRWADKWGITADNKAEFTLKSQSLNSTGLNWTSGGVTVYCATGENNGQYSAPVAKTPTAQNPVGWPTIPKLGENITLTSQMAGTPTQVTRVPILNLQINNQSIAKVGRDGKDELCDHYIGLIGENDGTIQNITLRDVDMQVNVKETTPEQAGDGLRLSGTTALKALAKDDTDYRDIRAAGALCGVNTGTLENCALTRGTNTSVQSRVQAALYFDDKTTVQEPEIGTVKTKTNTYTYNKNEPRGIGGLVGVAMPKDEATMSGLSVAANVTVAGLLVDENTKPVTADAATDVTAEKARYAAAAMAPGTDGALWRSVGVGGVFGTLNADNFTTDANTAISSAATVTGSGFVGGVAGNLYSMAEQATLTGLTNTGTVSAGSNYKGDTAGDNRSAVLGQFFGGIAGYGRNVQLTGCTSTNRSDLTEAQLSNLVKNGYNSDGTLNDNSPLKGDFVGGLVGFGEQVKLTVCATGNGYVLGNRFVGGLAGGLTGSDLLQNGTNTSSVFGNRYVGGIVSVNGRGSTISDMTNTGLAAALGKDAAYAGGIVGLNDATWGTADGNAQNRATVLNCVNNMSGDNATDTNRVKLLQALSQRSDGVEMYASYVGGIVGFNGKNGDVTWSNRDKTTLGAILYGNAFVGGVAGYNDVDATITNTSGNTLTVTGQVVASGDAVGGFIGMNCAKELPAVTVTASRVAGVHAVGGVIGANLPVGSFNVENGAFTANAANAASGRVEADGVAGGIIGYNRLLASMPANLTDRKVLLPSFDADGVLKPGTGTSAATEITFTGFINELNLVANAYVGGIVGYNDADTRLKIVNATNGSTNNSSSVGSLSMNTSGSLYNGVKLSALADTRFTFPAASSTGENKEDTTRGYLAGGIIGYATKNTTLQGCTNHGVVTHRRAAGGLAGWNDGTISGGTMQAALGSPQEGYRYLGGIAGVNAGTITDAFPTASSTVRGEYDIGGVAGVNIGGATISITKETPAFAVSATTNAGGVAGSNVGTITASGATLKATVTATANAGGFAGENTCAGTYTGTIKGEQNSYAVTAGNVQATNYAGGAAGINDAEILYIDNQATVRATTKFAGGIAGTNKANGHISHSRHTNTTANAVYATNGMAGGIAGNNEENAQIDNVAVNGNVTAVNGEAGGIAASNSGRIGNANANGGVPGGTVGSGTVIKSGAQSIGAAVTYNNDKGTMYGVTLEANAQIAFDSRAVTVGGLAGQNTGTIDSCTVSEGSLNLKNGLNAGANAITLGGAVGGNAGTGTVKDTRVELSIGDNLSRIANLGGVAGQNDATLDQCVYKGTLGGTANDSGIITGGATNVGNTLGGIAGINNKTITSCTVEHITLRAQGVSNVTETQTADQKLNSASHVGGIVGRNAGTVSDSYIAADNGSLVAARYGFVGGIAGSNNGTIQDSGSQAMFTASGTNKSLMGKLTGWLAQKNADGTPLTQKEKYANQNAMVSAIKDGEDASFKDVRGVDTAPKNSDAGYSAYSDANLKKNQLTVTLSGSRTSDTDRADGYLGGVTGFNATNGSIVRTATGKWFVYGDNVSTASTVGGAVGQNETAQEMTNVVNCAAVRRFTRVKSKADYNNDNIKGDSRIDTQVGGIVCIQQNRTSDEWKFTGCVNLGNVFNSRSNNIGGIISLWVNYGGRLEYCYNFGTLQTNTNDTRDGASGTVGGIAGYLREPVSGSATNIVSCGNYGAILWTKASDNVVYGANDVGGILGKIEMASANDYMVLNIVDCVNGPVTLQAKSMVSGIMGWMGPYDDAPKYVQVNIDRCRNLSYDLQAEGTGVNGANDVYYAGIVGNRGGGKKNVGKITATTSVTNCFAIYNVASSGNYSPIAFLRTEEDKVVCTNCYYIDRSSVSKNGEANGSDFNKAFETMYHAANSQAIVPSNTDITAVPKDKGQDVEDSTYGKRLFLGIDKDPKAGTDNFFAAAMTVDNNAKTAYQAVNGRKNYIETTTTPQTIVEKDVGTENTETLASLLLWFKDRADGNHDTKNQDGYPGFADITDEAIQEYYLNVLDSEKPQAPKNISVKTSQVITDNNEVFGRYEVTWDLPDDNTHPASYYTVDILACDEKGNVTQETPLMSANVYERRYIFENRDDLGENQPEYFVVRVTPHNSCGTGPDNSAKSGANRFLLSLPTPQIEVRLVRQPNVNAPTNDANKPFAYEQVLVLKNYKDYEKYEGWKVTVTAKKAGKGTDTFIFDASNPSEYSIRNAMGGGNKDKLTEITAVAEPKNTEYKLLRSDEYSDKVYVPSSYIGQNKDWNSETGLADGNLVTKSVAFTGTSIENMTITATLNFKPTHSTQSSPIYRVMLRAKYTGNDTVTLNGQTFPLNGQYITLAAREHVVPNEDTTFTFTNLPVDMLTDFEDWAVVAVPVNSGNENVVTRWEITEQEAAKALAEYGANAWYKVGLELVRKADGTGYDYEILTPLCFVDNQHTDTEFWYNAVTTTQKQVVMARMGENKTILPAPTLQKAEDFGEGNIDDNNQLTYTFTWTQEELNATSAMPNYDVKLYGLVPYITPGGQEAIGQEEIPLKDDIDLTSKIQKNGNKFTLTINVDTYLASGSSSWHYSAVRLLVARVAQEDSDAIGAAATADYNVKQRLPEASVSTIAREILQQDNADQLLYNVGWTKLGNKQIDHYDLYAVDVNNPTTPLDNWSTETNVGELTVDLEQYQGRTLQFYVVARKAKGDSSIYDGPNSALSNSVAIVTRATAPVSSTAAFETTEPSQSNFLNSLKLNMTLDAAPTGNIYYTGYVFAAEEDYKKIKDLADAWQNIAKAGQAKADAEQKLNDAIEEMITKGKAERIIKAGDQAAVGQLATVSGNTASYILGSEDFKVKPEHAMQYLLPAVRLMPTSGEEISSNWHYIIRDADKAQLPAIKLDTPNAILSNVTVEQTAKMYRSASYTNDEYVDEGAVKLQRFTVEWSAVNVYQNDDQTLRNLTDSYRFTVTSLDGTSYTIDVQTYAKDTVTTENDVEKTHRRGEILKVTKTIDGVEHDLTPDENGRYDLSPAPVYSETEPTQIIDWTSKPTTICGTVRENNSVQYYSAEVVPTLEAVLSEEGAEPLYRITLPELQTRVDAEDETPLLKVTGTVTLTAEPCKLAGTEGKTTASDEVTVKVNEQSENQTEGEAFVLAVQRAAAELPALPPATPETALLAG